MAQEYPQDAITAVAAPTEPTNSVENMAIEKTRCAPVHIEVSRGLYLRTVFVAKNVMTKEATRETTENTVSDMDRSCVEVTLES